MDSQFPRHELLAAFRFVLSYCAVGPAFDRIHEDCRREFEKHDWSRAYIVAIGKAAVPMVTEFLERFRVCPDAGVVASPNLVSWADTRFEPFKGGHPAPNEDSFRAADAALRMLRGAGPNDLVVFLVSGGGSACFELPLLETVGLDDLIALNHLLTGDELNIVEINTIRKHLSRVKGGRLAEPCRGARQVTLYVSDVPEGRESFVASGPSMPDDSSLSDMRDIIERYRLESRLPGSVTAAIRSGLVTETPKPGDVAFSRASWFKLLDNSDAVRAAVAFATQAGWRSVVVDGLDDLHPGEVAQVLVERADRELHNCELPLAVIAGGELISPIRGRGNGGRNQAFAIECVERIARRPIAVLSAGTDGIDGNSLAAGAVVDGTTLQRSRKMGLDVVRCREESDSGTFFSALGDQVVTGATGTNVRDIRIVLAWRQ